jgi:hypothetical protein
MSENDNIALSDHLQALPQAQHKACKRRKCFHVIGNPPLSLRVADNGPAATPRIIDTSSAIAPEVPITRGLNAIFNPNPAGFGSKTSSSRRAVVHKLK